MPTTERRDLPFLKALRREHPDRVPVWILRQAGRYLPEYRALRERVDFLTLCRTPELAAEAAVAAVRRLGVDAAILVSVLLLPALGMGFALRYDPGPVIGNPVRSREAIDSLRPPDMEKDLRFVGDAVRCTREALGDEVPVIGFGPAPATLAAYLVEGGGSDTWTTWKSLLYRDPDAAHALLRKLVEALVPYLAAQARAGADAIQLFDTWASILGPRELDAFAIPYARRLVAGLKEELGTRAVPAIYFAQGDAPLRGAGSLGVEAISVDWRHRLSEVRERVGRGIAIQGNLDPHALFAPKKEIEGLVQETLREAGREAGYVFNLGHGILPTTPLENAVALVEAVKKHGRRPRLR
jgi:uroporphyrinogen decarboxylase